MTKEDRLNAEANVRRMTLAELHQDIAKHQTAVGMDINTSASKRWFVERQLIAQTELDRRIIQQHDARDRRYAVDLSLANLSWSERDLVNSVVALLSDPALEEQRRKVVEGEVAIAMEGGEVTWIPTSELEAA
jgi:hypothetical protein